MTNAVMEMDVMAALKGDILLISSPLMCPSPLRGSDADRYWKESSIWGKTFKINVNENITRAEDGAYLWNRPQKSTLKCPPGSLYFDSADSNDSITYEIPSPVEYNPSRHIDERILRSLQDTAKHLYETTEYSLQCGETLLDLQLTPGGLQAWWMALVAEPDLAHEYLAKAQEASISQMKELSQAIGKYVDMLSIAHDLGDMRGITIGEDTFRNIYKLHYKEIFDEWHKISNVKINFHTCGAVGIILDDLIECGVDIYNPVQISAIGMSPESLKARFGDQLIFYGGAFDSVATPKENTYEKVYEAVKNNIMTLSKNGGYIFAGLHNMVGDISEIHLKAVLDAFEIVKYY